MDRGKTYRVKTTQLPKLSSSDLRDPEKDQAVEEEWTNQCFSGLRVRLYQKFLGTVLFFNPVTWESTSPLTRDVRYINFSADLQNADIVQPLNFQFRYQSINAAVFPKKRW